MVSEILDPHDIVSSTREVRGRIVRWETCPSVLVGGLYAAYFVSNFPGAAKHILHWLAADHQRTRGMITSSHQDLVRALPGDKGNMRHSLQTLEARSLIVIGRSPGGKAESLWLTPEGQKWAAQLAGSCDEGETDVAAMGYRACNSLYVAPAPLSAGGSSKMASKVRNRVRNVSLWCLYDCLPEGFLLTGKVTG